MSDPNADRTAIHGSADANMRKVIGELPVPQFDETAFTTPRPLSESTVAIVTSAALHNPDDHRFVPGDTSYRMIGRNERHLVLGHWSPNFDRTAIAIDLNVVYPIDRLEELAAAKVIGSVAPRHVSFAGNQPDDVSTVRLDSGPAAAAELLADGVDVVVLTPV
jgi:D-proline reductase (dithiol) PrdB